MTRSRPLCLLLIGAALLLLAPGAGAQQGQPSYDVLRVQVAGATVPYNIWIEWPPALLTTPDGGAWAFFTAVPDTVESDGSRKLYAARFDSATAVWLPAQPLPGGLLQFGASAVVDGQGSVHLVYTDRATAEANAFGTIVYTQSTSEGGWTTPEPIAPDATAGHQLAPSLTIDGNGVLHVAWQDQRGVEQARQAESAIYADVFVSDRVEGGWSEPVQVSVRPAPEINANWPQIEVDGDRLVAVWSVYDLGMGGDRAARVEWSSRPLGDPTGWAAPQTLLDGRDSFIGGRLLDLAAHPNGGVAIAYGRGAAQTAATPVATATPIPEGNALYLRRLARGTDVWTPEVLLGAGNRGGFPTLAIAADGTAYVTYNVEVGMTVEVGAVAVAPDAVEPGPEIILSPAEEGTQGRPVVVVDQSGRVWILYLHEPAERPGDVQEVRSLRGALIPSTAAATTPAP